MIMCGLPFSFLENEYFVAFCQTLNYKPMCTKTLHRRLIEREEEQDRVISEIIQSTEKKSIFVDGWTGKNIDHFQSIGVHVIDKDWNSYVFCLAFDELEKRETGNLYLFI